MTPFTGFFLWRYSSLLETLACLLHGAILYMWNGSELGNMGTITTLTGNPLRVTDLYNKDSHLKIVV